MSRSPGIAGRASHIFSPLTGVSAGPGVVDLDARGVRLGLSFLDLAFKPRSLARSELDQPLLDLVDFLGSQADRIQTCPVLLKLLFLLGVEDPGIQQSLIRCLGRVVDAFAAGRHDRWNTRSVSSSE